MLKEKIYPLITSSVHSSGAYSIEIEKLLSDIIQTFYEFIEGMELPEYVGSSSMIDRLTKLIAEEVQHDTIKAILEKLKEMQGE